MNCAIIGSFFCSCLDAEEAKLGLKCVIVVVVTWNLAMVQSWVRFPHDALRMRA